MTYLTSLPSLPSPAPRASMHRIRKADPADLPALGDAR